MYEQNTKWMKCADCGEFIECDLDAVEGSLRCVSWYKKKWHKFQRSNNDSSSPQITPSTPLHFSG